jgi:hypothetical protein
MLKFLAILLIIGTSQCLLPNPIKDGLKTAWAGIIDVACKCLIDEAKTKTQFLPAGMGLDQFIDKVNNITKSSAISGFNSVIDKMRRNRRLGAFDFVSDIGKAIAGGVVDAGNAVADAGKAAAGSVADAGKAAAGGVADAGKAAAGGVADAGKAAAGGVVEAGKTVANGVGTAIDATGNGVNAAAHGVADAAGAIADTATKAVDAAGGVVDKVKGVLSDAARVVLAGVVCPGAVLLVKNAINSIGVVGVPACATGVLETQCRNMVGGLGKARRLLRRLRMLKSELENF